MIHLKVEPRPKPSRIMRYASPLMAIGLMIVSGMVVFAVLGKNPMAAFHAFFIEPINDFYGWGELGIKAAPLMLIGIGLAIGFRANVWNIGAEGQLVFGAIAGGGIALLWPEGPRLLVLPTMVAAGALGGMAWASIPAVLKTRFNTSEILVSLMLTYVAGLLMSYMVHGPWRDPDGYGFPQSQLFSESALLPMLIEGTRLHAGTLISLAVVAASWVFIGRSFIGFQMQVTGLAFRAAHYSGFNANRMIWIGLLSGGCAAGVAGVCEVAGPIGQLMPSVSPGYGFAAIIVAFVGRLNPVGIFWSSLLMALLYLGGESAQMQLDLPSAVTGIFQGMLLFYLLAADFLILYRLRIKRPMAKNPITVTEKAAP